MGFFDKIFETKTYDDDQSVSMPWDEKPSIYDHVRSHVDPTVHGLTEGGETLPDEERPNAGSQIRWAAGAMDGVATHHVRTGGPNEQVQKTVKLVMAYCEQPTATNKAVLYKEIMEEKTVSIIDHVIQAITSEDQIDHQRLYELVYSFATEGTDREPVKFGIAILGLFREPANEEIYQTLARHDEFTLFCAVALANASDDSDRSLWALAKNVDGWGRIHVVERLAQTEDAEIKNWLLREGYRNSVMYEYLAYTCATAGRLLAALSEEDVDRDLLTSSGEILQALIAGGPAEGIEDYDEGAIVTEMFLGHVSRVEHSIADFLSVNAIRRHVSDDEVDWDTRAAGGWTNERRSSMLESCDTILNQQAWIEKVYEALFSEDCLVFGQASQAAQALGMDVWEHHWRRWESKPTDSGRWFHVVCGVDEERFPTVLQAAENSIDLAAIATGPSDELGMGPDFAHHSCLDYLLQELPRFPGQGEAFIAAGLKSPVVRNRNKALAALAVWQREHRNDELLESLRAAAQIEPDNDVRERMLKVLKGEQSGDGTDYLAP